MIDSTVNLKNVYQTAAQMRRFVENYYKDLGLWLNVPLIEFYAHVCGLPYRPDPIGVETVSRPRYTLNPDYAPRDCDDKAVLIASWCQGNGRKKRFVSTSTRPDRRLCHVFVQLDNGLFLDATYPTFRNYMGNYPYFPKVTNLEGLTEFF